jgi:putative DNA primase/helicase
MKQNYSILDANGYLLVPVNGKRPIISDWTKFKQNDPLWPQDYPNLNIGMILSDSLVALDVDVTDIKCSDVILKNIIKNFGKDILVRVGKYPKFLVLFKVQSGDTIKKHKLYLNSTLGSSDGQAVEILGLGQQFVCYGKHPDTGTEYQWVTKHEPLNTHINDLPILSLKDIQTWLTNLQNILPEGWTVSKIDGLPQKFIPAQVTNYPAVVNFMGNKSQNLSKDDIVLHLRNINADSYDVWIRVGMALHDYYDEAETGLEIWDDWSYSSVKYKTGECDKLWDSFYKKINNVTIAYIVMMSNNAKKNLQNPTGYPACITKIISGDYPKKLDFSVLSNILIDYNQSHNLNDDNLKNEFCENHKSTRKSYSDNLKEFDNQLSKHSQSNFDCEYVRTSGIDSIKMCINCPKSKVESDNLVRIHEKVPNFSLNCPDFIIRSNGISLQATIHNLEYLLSCYNIICQYDEILKRRSMIFPPNDTQINADLEDEAKLCQIISLAVLNELPPQTVDNLISIFARNTINPVMDWIESKNWDGIDRINDLLDSIHLKDVKHTDYMHQVMHVWLVQCFAALDNGKRSPISNAIAKFELCLVFTGRQGTGKTSWFKSLLPANLKEYFQEGVSLNINDKDSKKHALSAWISELGEIDATFRRSDIAEIKSFFSNTHDSIRLPYARVANNYARRTSFCGSVNETGFLHDITGNRRFLPLEVMECNKHQVNLQQLWAQIRHEYLGGKQWWLNAEQDKLLQDIQHLYKASSHVVEALESCFDFDTSVDAKINGNFITITKALNKCGFENPKKIEIAEARNYIEGHGFERKKNNVLGYYLVDREH